MTGTRALALACAVSLSAALPAGGYTNRIENQTTVSVNSNSWHVLNDYLYVGHSTHGNTLKVLYSDVTVDFDLEIGGESIASDNLVQIGGSNAYVYATDVTVGKQGSANQLLISGGGRVVAEEFVIGENKVASNNLVRVEGSSSSLVAPRGSLRVGYNGSGNRLEVLSGGRVSSALSYIGASAGANNNTVMVDGAGSSWWSTQRISVGSAGSLNSLIVTNGGFVYSDQISVGSEFSRGTSLENKVLVMGQGSVLNGLNIYLTGGGGANGNGNNLTIADKGAVESRTFLNNATLNFESGGRLSAESYTQANAAVLQFRDITGSALIRADTNAHFDAGAVIEFTRAASELAPDQIYIQSIVDTTSLSIGNAGGLPDVNELEIQADDLGTLFDIQLTASTEALTAQLMRRSLTTSAGFTDGSDLAGVSDEIDMLYSGQDANAIRQWNRYNTMSGDQQRAELKQLYDRGAPNYQHSQGMIGGIEQTRNRADVFLAGRGIKPVGAAGPSSREVPLQGWIKAYGSWGEHDGASGLPGYDLNAYGTVVGFDKLFKDMLVGIAGGYAKSDLSLVDNGSSVGKTGYGIIYVSKGTEDWFGDFSISHGITKVEADSGTVGGTKADFNSDSFAVYVGGGKEIEKSEGRYLITPEASLLTTYYGQGGYTESSASSTPRIIDAYERWGFLSTLGAAFTYQKEFKTFVLKPELRTYWLHEFNEDADEIGYSLAGGTGRYTFQMLPPEEDTLEIGAGIGTRFNDRLELTIDVDGRFSENYQATSVSGRIAYEF